MTAVPEEVERVPCPGLPWTRGQALVVLLPFVCQPLHLTRVSDGLTLHSLMNLRNIFADVNSCKVSICSVFRPRHAETFGTLHGTGARTCKVSATVRQRSNSPIRSGGCSSRNIASLAEICTLQETKTRPTCRVWRTPRKFWQHLQGFCHRHVSCYRSK